MGEPLLNDPDVTSYLDVEDSSFRHDWANAVNAWWSSLSPGTIGLVLGVSDTGSIALAWLIIMARTLAQEDAVVRSAFCVVG